MTGSRVMAEKLMFRISLVVICFMVTACVTINIYFPAAAAEKAADRIIDEVWQLKNGTPPPAKPTEPKPGEAK